MLTKSDKSTFWKTVELCLVAFHKFSPNQAKVKVRGFRHEIESDDKPTDIGMIYHEEPFILACDIAGEQLDIGKYQKKYQALLHQTHSGITN